MRLLEVAGDGDDGGGMLEAGQARGEPLVAEGGRDGIRHRAVHRPVGEVHVRRLDGLRREAHERARLLVGGVG